MRGVLAHVTEASCCNSQPSRQEVLQFTAASSVMSLQHPCLAGKKKVSSTTSVADESDEDTGGGEQIQEAEEEDSGEEAPGPKASEPGNQGGTDRGPAVAEGREGLR